MKRNSALLVHRLGRYRRTIRTTIKVKANQHWALRSIGKAANHRRAPKTRNQPSVHGLPFLSDATEPGGVYQLAKTFSKGTSLITHFVNTT